MFSTTSNNQGSRQSSSASSGQASHRASNLWAAASLSGPQSGVQACNTSSNLPDFNGGHRQNSKPVQAVGDGAPVVGGPGQEAVATLGMTAAQSKLQGNSTVSPCDTRVRELRLRHRIRPRII